MNPVEQGGDVTNISLRTLGHTQTIQSKNHRGHPNSKTKTKTIYQEDTKTGKDRDSIKEGLANQPPSPVGRMVRH